MNNPIGFRQRCSGEVIPVHDDITTIATSVGLGWTGLLLEVGKSSGWDAEDLMFDGHYIGFNLGNSDLQFELRDELRWAKTCLQPQSFLLNPEGCPFSLRVGGEATFAVCLIDAKFLDSVAEQHFELRKDSGIHDEILAPLLHALIACISHRGPYAQKLAGELIHAFVYALATRHGSPVTEFVTKGGIAPRQLRSLLSWIEENLANPITVELMASRLGVSAAHFSREFKRSLGITPWGYVVQRRLDGARALLDSGASVTTAALSFGFSDQSHLSRLFKERYGVPPTTFTRARKR